MKVVAMGSIIIGTQNRPEPFARAAKHNAEEFALRSGSAMPMFGQADASTIGEDKCRYINGFGA